MCIRDRDAIIATAADNALKFKNTAMESASASRMVLCFIFGAAFMLTILMLGILRKRIISPIYVLLESAEKIEQGIWRRKFLMFPGMSLGNWLILSGRCRRV